MTTRDLGISTVVSHKIGLNNRRGAIYVRTSITITSSPHWHSASSGLSVVEELCRSGIRLPVTACPCGESGVVVIID